VLIRGFALFLLCGTAVATAEDRSVETLIAELGAPSFAAREQAMTALHGRGELAAAEWHKILEIPPEGDVYDMNAMFRLGQIEARAGHPAEAADWLEKGLAAFRNARGRGGMAIAGASEEEIEVEGNTPAGQHERATLKAPIREPSP
jgi:hypothetical protein